MIASGNVYYTARKYRDRHDIPVTILGSFNDKSGRLRFYGLVPREDGTAFVAEYFEDGKNISAGCPLLEAPGPDPRAVVSEGINLGEALDKIRACADTIIENLKSVGQGQSSFPDINWDQPF